MSDSLGPRASKIRVRDYDLSPEGSIIIIYWVHEFDGDTRSMVVWGHNHEEAWRRAQLLEDEQCAAETPP